MKTPTGIKNLDKATIENYPNPFNPSTTINYNIPTSGSEENSIQIKVFNTLDTLVNKFQN